MDNRNQMGKNKEGVIFPIAPNLSEMSDAYLKFIEEVKAEIQKQRISVVLNANSSMICLYWNIGRAILKKQEEEGWGAKVIDRIAKDLKDAFPEMSGFSPRNIKYMRKFAESWPDFEIVQQVVAQIPWRTNRMLLDKLDSMKSRLWYAHKTIENGWSSNVLELQIQGELMGRSGRSVNNFPVALPPMDSDMVNQVFKDPYLFDFLGTDMPRREVEIERQLTEHIQSFLLELGQGFAFVGRQVLSIAIARFTLTGFLTRKDCEMNRNKLAWLYCRVAHEDKMALEAQEKRLIEFAEKNGYMVAGVSKDTGSGLTMERPGWKEVEQAVTTQGIGAVLAINSSRIARNTKELLACAEKLHRQGVRLTTETEGNIGKPPVAMYMRLARAES